MEYIKDFISKRNKVCLFRDGEVLKVFKKFPDEKIMNHEISIYKLLNEKNIPCASLLGTDDSSITLSYIDGDNYQTILDKAMDSKEKPDMEKWEKLADWILNFKSKTGLIIGDSNLRNFILSKDGELYALDFENCIEGNPIQSVASVCAFILLSNNTSEEKKSEIVGHITEYFCEKEGISEETFTAEIDREKARITARRKAKSAESGRITENCSAIVLAGGKGTRMGQNKATLMIGEKSFVQHIVDRLKEIGFTDIMVSGYSDPVEGATNIEDVYKDKGPLAGIYSCMRNAKYPNCFVMSSDSPLVPEGAILGLIKAYKENGKKATVLSCNGDTYSVLGVYSKALLKKLEDALNGEEYSIRKALGKEDVEKFKFDGDSLLVSGCNTPEEYAKTIQAYSENAGKGKCCCK